MLMAASLLRHPRCYTSFGIEQQRHVCTAKRISKKTSRNMSAAESPLPTSILWKHGIAASSSHSESKSALSTGTLPSMVCKRCKDH